jgi:membrane protein implicated in regulation of membrane protease activity
MGAMLRDALGRLPRWTLAAAAAVLLLVIVLAFASSFWGGLAVIIIVAIALAAYLAWVRLPERYEEGPDKAEEAELRKRREEMEGES